MKKINEKFYFLKNDFKTNNKIRKSIILKNDYKYNTFFLSIVVPILNNLIKGMSKVEFNNAKSKNYDLDYNVSFKSIDNNILLNITVDFIDLSILNDMYILDFIENIFNGLTYNKKDIENAILDYKNYLISIEDQKDKFIKILLNDKIFSLNNDYLSFEERKEVINNISIEKVEEFLSSIDYNNGYFLFEGKEKSLEKINPIMEKLYKNNDLIIYEKNKKEVNKEKEIIEKIKSENQISLALNFQSEMNMKDEHKLRILSYLFGKGVYSKLFVNVREKKSLCYSVYSIEDIRYGIDVFTGVDFKNKEETIKEIKKQFKEIQKGNFLKEFELAKKQYYNEIISNKDNFVVQSNYLDKNIVYKTNVYETNYILKAIENITKKDIEEFSKKFILKKTIVLN